jgi:hypothetical protein
MLTEHWRAVEALAAELIVHRRVEGVQEIVDQAVCLPSASRSAYRRSM